MQGWIKLYRQVKNHWLWKDPDKFQKWIDLLLRVNHKPNTILFNEQIIEVERGETITSKLKLSKEWGWSRGKVDRFLTKLECDKMITTDSTTQYTSIKVCNYNKFQGFLEGDSTTDSTTHKATDEQHTVQHPSINKNEEKEKNEKKVYSANAQDVFDYWNSQEGIIDHQKLTKTMANKIDKEIKESGIDSIYLAIDRLVQAVNDKKYYYNYRWGLYKFLKQSNGYTTWLDNGSSWINYNVDKKSNHSKYSKEEVKKLKQLVSDFGADKLTSAAKEKWEDMKNNGYV